MCLIENYCYVRKQEETRIFTRLSCHIVYIYSGVSPCKDKNQTLHLCVYVCVYIWYVSILFIYIKIIEISLRYLPVQDVIIFVDKLTRNTHINPFDFSLQSKKSGEKDWISCLAMSKDNIINLYWNMDGKWRWISIIKVAVMVF